MPFDPWRHGQSLAQKPVVVARCWIATCILAVAAAEESIETLRPLNPPYVVDATKKNEIQMDAIHRTEDAMDIRSGSTVLGCWPLQTGDGPDRDAPFHDRTCAEDANRKRPCRSGFPFFRFFMPEGVHYSQCTHFCTSKGLDLAGSIAVPGKGFECRCGASRGNAAAWNRFPPLGFLLVPWDKKLNSSKVCPILVQRYHGYVEYGTIPDALVSVDSNDRDYILEIAKGTASTANQHGEPQDRSAQGGIVHSDEIMHLDKYLEHADLKKIKQMMKGDVRSAFLQTELMCSDLPDPRVSVHGKPASCSDLISLCQRQDPVGLRIQTSCPYSCNLCPAGTPQNQWSKCFPEQCSSGGPWQTQDENGMFTINYVFDATIDFIRRDAFEQATHAWERGTCIRFKEGGDKPRVRVVVENPHTCWSETGFPGHDKEAKVNLGSCNSFSHVGNMIHELGHLLGMSHEHKRPDAIGKIYLPPPLDEYRGPYLTIHWQNIPDYMRDQYSPDPRAYTGSGSQQDEDPSQGYSDYDYESIMHYSRQVAHGRAGPNFDTVNPAFNNVVGQRRKPSSGDIRQIRDIYQCGGAERHVKRKVVSKSMWSFFGFEQDSMSRWNAGIWGSCRKAEDKQCYRKRQVSCVDLDGDPLDPGDCLSNSKPSALETCSCSARCEDHKDTGVWRLGSHLSCWQLQSFCEDETMGKHVRSTCPVTCKLCSTTNILLPGCDDMYPTSLIINESSMEDLTCTQLSQRGACKKFDVARRCLKSCGHCPSAPVTCADDKEFRDANNRSCTSWLGFVCSENISRACPASCGFCT